MATDPPCPAFFEAPEPTQETPLVLAALTDFCTPQIALTIIMFEIKCGMGPNAGDRPRVDQLELIAQENLGVPTPNLSIYALACIKVQVVFNCALCSWLCLFLSQLFTNWGQRQ